MGWKHIVLEGVCLYNRIGKGVIPHCCEVEPGVVGLYCLDYDEEEHKKCPFFAYSEARSTIVLTGSSGEEIAFSEFSSDDNISDETKWLELEKQWTDNWERELNNV